MSKEEYAIILEYLPNGYPLENKMLPVAQAVGKESFTLLELVPRRESSLEPGEEVYIGTGKREKIGYILGRLKREKLTDAAKDQLEEFIKQAIENNPKKFVDFFNNAEAINKRVHQMELLPGLGKKHMQELLKQREESEFESFDDMKKRVPNLPDPKKAVQKRIIEELTQMERHNLFVNN